MNDLKFAFRQLLKNPGFTAVAVLSLALGIAANTTIFSFVNALLLRPPPVKEPDALWQVWRFRPGATSTAKRHGVWSHPALDYFQTHARSFAAFGGCTIEATSVSWSRDGFGEPAQALFVSGNFFDIAGIRPLAGRFFLPVEGQTPAAHPVVVVSHGFWQNQLGADPQAVGRPLSVNGVALTIVGIAPKQFTGITAGVVPDLWFPIMMRPAVTHDPDALTRTTENWLFGLARLKAGVTPAQAQAELTTLVRGFEESIGSNRLEDGAALLPSLLVPLPLRGYVRAFTALLMGAVFVVLLIACANAANLQLARSAARRPELLVRAALGAGRARIIRQLLTESLLLAGLGGGLGLLLAVWSSGLLMGLMPGNLPLRLEVEFDGRVLIFTAFVSLFTGIIFGLAPALRGSRLDMATALKDQTRGLAVRQSRFAQALIVGQMALCLILLTAATLCLRSLWHASRFDPGFVVTDRVAVRLNLGDHGFTPEQTREFQARLLERVQEMPGIRTAAWTRYLPLGLERSNGRFHIEGGTQSGDDAGIFFEQFTVSPGYFATLGTPLLQGREFTTTDREGMPRVAIVNEAASTLFWPGENPIGRRIYSGGSGPDNALEIVGVAATGRYRTLGEEPRPVFFECFLQGTYPTASLVAHVQGASGPVLASIRDTLRGMDSRLALTDVTTMEQHLSLVMFPAKASGLLLGVLGLVAMLLAVSGLFGVIAHSVAQRTREVGIRMAVGAQPFDVLRLVVGQGMKLAGAGVAVGLAGALAATHLLRGLLFGVTPLDPLTFAVVPLGLLAVALLACWLPASRAASVNPMEALRAE